MPGTTRATSPYQKKEKLADYKQMLKRVSSYHANE